jgi:hypothetical protein
MTTSGGYCSIECEAMEKMADIACHCGHSVCAGDTDHLPSLSSLPS